MRRAVLVVGRAIGLTGKILFVGVLLVGNFIMNCIGALVCAITSN